MLPNVDIASSSGTVVVADDDAATRLLIRAALEQDGWTVEEATDGAHACEAVQRVQPAIVLLDVSMPKLDGFEACARLRTLPSGRHIPVMMITGMDDQESIRRAYEVGATDFLSKPISFTILRQRVGYMHRAEQNSRDLRNERDFVSAVVDHCAALVLILDPMGRITRFNESCERASGLALGEVQGRLVWDVLSSPEEQERERATFERLIFERGTSHYGGTWTTKDGNRREIAWSNSVLLDSDGEVEHVVCTGLDITDRNQAEQRAEYLASYDPLTALPNRRLVTECLDETITNTAEGQHVAVLVLSLDRFQDVNAAWGRAAGDGLLTVVADRLTKSLRLSDALAGHSQPVHTELGRLGADEFSVLITDVPDTNELAATIERLQLALVRPIKIKDQELTVTASVGAALYPADGSNGETLLRNAESAMHAAREKLRGSHHFYSLAMHTRISDRMSLEIELRQAVDREEFVLHYQPKISAASGRLAGAEALVRWQHPSRGLVEPASFISLAEEAGLIVSIGKQVIRRVCDQVVSWLESGLEAVPVAVNLSSAQIHDADLLAHIASILNESTLDPNYLAVEITESMIMRDTGKAREILKTLGELGVQVAIDDFGTGHSSLSALKVLPIQQLKIDRAFVKDLVAGSKDVAITRAIIAMAHGLGLSVVAEGVESEEQLAILREEGCDEVQGFLIGRPLSSSQFAELLDRPISRSWRRARNSLVSATMPLRRLSHETNHDAADHSARRYREPSG